MSKKFIDKIRLGSGMSLMLGNLPSQMGLECVGVCKPQLDISKFGFFESATPNFETYYPEVKDAQSIKPDDGDFIKPVFRMLSEVIVRKNYNPVDFSENSVLKNSMNKLLGQTIYPNHEAIVGNELGTVSAVSWQKSYTTKNGVFVPAGINGEFKIDAKSHPNVARKILMEPPAIHSNSVTVEFEWERSHPSMDMDEFRGKLATLGPDGKLVRRIATLIRNYHETSLVPHGADSYAQVLDKEGKITNPEYADSVYSLSMQGKEKPSFYYFDYREDLIKLNDKPEEQFKKPDLKNQTPMKKITLLASQVFMLGLFGAKIEDGKTSTEVELTDESLAKLENALKLAKEKEDSIAGLNAKVTELTNSTAGKVNEVNTLTAEVNTLKSENTKLKDANTARVDKFRQAVKTSYIALVGDKADEAILTNIRNADEELLSSLSKTYNEQLEEKFPTTCNDCHSTNVSKATASHGADSNSGNKGSDAGKNKVVIRNEADVEAELLKESQPGFILSSEK